MGPPDRPRTVRADRTATSSRLPIEPAVDRTGLALGWTSSPHYRDAPGSAYHQHVLRRIVDRIRKSDAWRRRGEEHHLLGFGRTDRPAIAKLPRHPEQLLRADSWRRLSQLADQRIRAHRGERLSVGEMVETVSHEVEDAVAGQPIEASMDQWRAWAAATETPWPVGFHEHLLGAQHAAVDDVEIALHVQTDLIALMPQLVAVRLSENRA